MCEWPRIKNFQSTPYLAWGKLKSFLWWHPGPLGSSGCPFSRLINLSAFISGHGFQTCTSYNRQQRFWWKRDTFDTVFNACCLLNRILPKSWSVPTGRRCFWSRTAPKSCTPASLTWARPSTRTTLTPSPLQLKKKSGLVKTDPLVLLMWLVVHTGVCICGYWCSFFSCFWSLRLSLLVWFGLVAVLDNLFGFVFRSTFLVSWHVDKRSTSWDFT